MRVLGYFSSFSSPRVLGGLMGLCFQDTHVNAAQSHTHSMCTMIRQLSWLQSTAWPA